MPGGRLGEHADRGRERHAAAPGEHDVDVAAVRLHAAPALADPAVELVRRHAAAPFGARSSTTRRASPERSSSKPRSELVEAEPMRDQLVERQICRAGRGRGSHEVAFGSGGTVEGPEHTPLHARNRERRQRQHGVLARDADQHRGAARARREERRQHRIRATGCLDRVVDAAAGCLDHRGRRLLGGACARARRPWPRIALSRRASAG